MQIQTKKIERLAICTKNIEEVNIYNGYLKYFNVQGVNCSDIKVLKNLDLKFLGVWSEIVLQTQKFTVKKLKSGI